MIVKKDGITFKMVCFKTPWVGRATLKELNAEMPLSDVIQHYKKEHGLKITKVIDLTTSVKFYQRS